MPGFNGHHHSHFSWQAFSPDRGPYEWHQYGCGHVRGATYCAGEKWGLGYGLNHVDTERRTVQQEYIQVLDHTCIGGRHYLRDAMAS
jgi:hypothetical protein